MILTHFPVILDSHFPCLIFQIDSWCDDAFGETSIHLGSYDNPNDYILSDTDKVLLQDFVMGPRFNPFLQALDRDRERVAERVQQAAMILSFKELQQESAMRSLHRSLQQDEDGVVGKDFEPDDYMNIRNPLPPFKWHEWYAINNHTRVDGDGLLCNTVMGLLCKTVSDLATYVYKQQAKVDHILRQLKDGPGTPGISDYLTLTNKYPFLLDCDDHVAKIPHTVVPQLSRTATVGTVSFLCVLCLMVSLHCCNIFSMSYDCYYSVTIS